MLADSNVVCQIRKLLHMEASHLVVMKCVEASDVVIVLFCSVVFIL